MNGSDVDLVYYTDDYETHFPKWGIIDKSELFEANDGNYSFIVYYESGIQKTAYFKTKKNAESSYKAFKKAVAEYKLVDVSKLKEIIIDALIETYEKIKKG